MVLFPPSARRRHVMARLPGVRRAMYTYIAEAVRLTDRGDVDAITTAPISKKALLTRICLSRPHRIVGRADRNRHYAMMLAGEKLKVVPVTIHCALRDVFRLLTGKNRNRHSHHPPRPAGVFPPAAAEDCRRGPQSSRGRGRALRKRRGEDHRAALEQARALGIGVSGPLPPDTLFYHAAAGRTMP